MKSLQKLFLMAWMIPSFLLATDITGAGSTFVYPMLAKWADAYKKETSIGVNYQSIGSGGGIKQIQSKTVDFGASDKPMTVDELAKEGLTQFPVVVGGTVPIVNIWHQPRRTEAHGPGDCGHLLGKDQEVE